MNASFEKKNKTQTGQNSHRKSNPAQSYPSRTLVQAQLEMTQPGDQNEQEANAVASTIVGGGKISRQISGGTGGSSGIAVSSQMESQLSRLQGGGRPMPDGLRSMMETGFGRDFSQVRLHTDSEASRMNSSIQAKAFTHGNDIYFNSGQYSPETTEGRRLLAHELTHVAQGNGRIGRAKDESVTRKRAGEDTDNDHLSPAQVAVLDMLTYLPLAFRRIIIEECSSCGSDGLSLDALISLLPSIPSEFETPSEKAEIWNSDTMTSAGDWKAIFEMIMNDAVLRETRILSVKNEGSGGELGYTMLFIQPSLKEAIVSFRGTGSKEWEDNFRAGADTDSTCKEEGVSEYDYASFQQHEALNTFQEMKNSLPEEYRNSITVTGHSKGGNKAKYVTLMDEDVNRAISFDGQGFSDEFINAHKKEIQKNEEKIVNYNASGDYVNILLNDVGKRVYIAVPESNYSSINKFKERHSLEILLDLNGEDSNGNRIAQLGFETVQDKNMAASHELLNSFLQSFDRTNELQRYNKSSTLALLGTIVQELMNNNGEEDALTRIIKETLNNKGDRQLLVYLIAYVLAYLDKYKKSFNFDELPLKARIIFNLSNVSAIRRVGVNIKFPNDIDDDINSVLDEAFEKKKEIRIGVSGHAR